MPLQDVVHEQDTQILLNHAQLAMVMWQKLQRKPAPPPQFFKHQLQVCVYENKGRILMNFETKPPFRILARSPHLVFWVVKNVFLLMIKQFQTHRNNNGQYILEWRVFRAKNWRVPPYSIKFAHGQLMRLVLCYLRVTLGLTDIGQQMIFRCLSQFPAMKAQANLRPYADSPEHSMVVDTPRICVDERSWQSWGH